mmetsp:Transcript_13874/g.39979  ORF Transcript_13874/g.39979 Transcript_13874/m.39979 type:complete len:294 (-) Transcript_13874:153-1034(-)
MAASCGHSTVCSWKLIAACFFASHIAPIVCAPGDVGVEELVDEMWPQDVEYYPFSYEEWQADADYGFLFALEDELLQDSNGVDFFGLKPEGQMPAAAFTCHDGQIFGLVLPHPAGYVAQHTAAENVDAEKADDEVVKETGETIDREGAEVLGTEEVLEIDPATEVLRTEVAEEPRSEPLEGEGEGPVQAAMLGEAPAADSAPADGEATPPQGGEATPEGVFHYVRYQSTAGLGGVRIHVDIFNPSEQFLIYPPTQGISSEWMMIFRRETGIGFEDKRAFKLGHRRPCAAVLHA